METARPGKLKSFFTDSSNLFVIQIVLVYVAWKVFHYFVTSPSAGVVHTAWLQLVILLGSFYAAICSFILNLLGQETYHTGIDIVFVHSRKVIWVQDHCLAIPAMVVFTGSIALFKGSWKNKLWFIPLGLLCIMLINVARVVFVSLTFEHMSAQFFEINHSVIYVIITYAAILLLIMWWMKRFSGIPAKPKVN